LSEHSGDGSPGAWIRVMMQGVEEFHREISSKRYRYMRLGLESTPLAISSASVSQILPKHI
jgi:hypothetical protein